MINLVPAATSSTLGLVKVKKTTSVESTGNSLSITKSNIGCLFYNDISSSKTITVTNNTSYWILLFFSEHTFVNNNHAISEGIVSILGPGHAKKINVSQSATGYTDKLYIYSQYLTSVLH